MDFAKGQGMGTSTISELDKVVTQQIHAIGMGLTLALAESVTVRRAGTPAGDASLDAVNLEAHWAPVVVL